MKALFKNATIHLDGTVKRADMSFDCATLSSMGDVSDVAHSLVFDNIVILPGFCDAHVHLREPGFSYKETIESGTAACAHGGYTAAMTMPNLKPAPDSPENLAVQLAAIRRGASIPVFPLGTITVGEMGEELSDMDGLAPDVVGFSDDGRGVQNDGMMREAMKRAKALGLPIVAHCEDNSLLRGGYIHDGEYARAHGHRGICSESEWGQIKRDLELVAEIGCAYHVCHVSTKESVELIREAKRRGLDVTCETAPHYLTLTDANLEEDGRFKMNPPLRAEEDRLALIEGIKDGTVDMIATDHAPHSFEEKSRGLENSMMGVVGIETAFPVLYTYLVKPGIITMEKLVELLSVNPRKRFGITSDVGYTVFDLSDRYEIDPNEFLSKGRSTPFAGMTVEGRCLLTAIGEKAVYIDGRLLG